MIGLIIEIIVVLVLLIWSSIATIGMIKGLKKVELYERIFNDMKERAGRAYAEMKDIDTLGAFEADDDVGQVFDEIKNIVDELNNYISENVNE